MVQVSTHLSTGLGGLDRALRGLIPGDNIVWRADAVDGYARFVTPYCRSALDRGRQLVYFRFAEHPPLVDEAAGAEVCRLDPRMGFEAFTAEIHKAIERSSRGTWYVFDCLSELAVAWRSDTMLGNFFRLTCPYLYDVEAIAYFGLLRHGHALEAENLILDTTQVFLDVYARRGRLFVHPIKVQQRHSPTMYMLHVWEDENFLPVAESAITAEILGAEPCPAIDAFRPPRGVWLGAFRAGEEALEDQRRRPDSAKCRAEAEEARRRLLRTAITRNPQMLELLERYFTLDDVLRVGRRIVGTGLIGGKAVGMLLARAILQESDPVWEDVLETHDSFYVGSDVFHSFLVRNGLWWEWQKHRDPVSYLANAEHARQRIVVGSFPEHTLGQFQAMLDYFGSSPIIVRSSSLLEDNFGHSFAGKYESVFLPNQGSREQRLHDFVSAVRTIYASTMSEKALRYRARRGMLGGDEQMALLVQRVSGAFHGRFFFPHLGAVGFSYNPFAWSREIDPAAGAARIVFGLGTRAVDRNDDDYPRVVALNAPDRRPVAGYDEVLHYAQRGVDVLDLQANQLVSESFEAVLAESSDVPLELFASRNEQLSRAPGGAEDGAVFPYVLTFDGLLRDTPLIPQIRNMLECLQGAYRCPVDVEFTVNFLRDRTYRLNIVQCRPLQIKVEDAVGEPPAEIAEEDLLLRACGAIVGHSRTVAIERVIFVAPSVYGQLMLRDRYAVARLVGRLVRQGAEAERAMLLLGPGRWGTSMPALGVPVSFNEISHVAALSEIVVMREGLVPDVSLGTHFFNELVEADILYVALFPEKEGNALKEDRLLGLPSRLAELSPDDARWDRAVRVIDAADLGGRRLVLHANTFEQRAVCFIEGGSESSGQAALCRPPSA